RFLGHKVPDGRLTPGTWADLRETEAIQRAVIAGGGRGALFQVAPDMASRREIEQQMFETGAELGCHVMFSSGAGSKGDGGVARTADLLARNKVDGKRMTAICHTRPSGAMFGLAQIAPFRNEAWKELMAMPSIADRVAALKDPSFKAHLIKRSKESGFTAAPEQLHP
ncbi:unnamed protein product, partial [Scytosiphon promiscuus]